jgi:hypothetical protein
MDVTVSNEPNPVVIIIIGDNETRFGRATTSAGGRRARAAERPPRAKETTTTRGRREARVVRTGAA